jgi:hypothetical protein
MKLREFKNKAKSNRLKLLLDEEKDCEEDIEEKELEDGFYNQYTKYVTSGSPLLISSFSSEYFFPLLPYLPQPPSATPYISMPSSCTSYIINNTCEYFLYCAWLRYKRKDNALKAIHSEFETNCSTNTSTGVTLKVTSGTTTSQRILSMPHGGLSMAQPIIISSSSISHPCTYTTSSSNLPYLFITECKDLYWQSAVKTKQLAKPPWQTINGGAMRMFSVGGNSTSSYSSLVFSKKGDENKQKLFENTGQSTSTLVWKIIPSSSSSNSLLSTTIPSITPPIPPQNPTTPQREGVPESGLLHAIPDTLIPVVQPPVPTSINSAEPFLDKSGDSVEKGEEEEMKDEKGVKRKREKDDRNEKDEKWNNADLKRLRFDNQGDMKKEDSSFLSTFKHDSSNSLRVSMLPSVAPPPLSLMMNEVTSTDVSDLNSSTSNLSGVSSSSSALGSTPSASVPQSQSVNKNPEVSSGNPPTDTPDSTVEILPTLNKKTPPVLPERNLTLFEHIKNMCAELKISYYDLPMNVEPTPVMYVDVTPGSLWNTLFVSTDTYEDAHPGWY